MGIAGLPHPGGISHNKHIVPAGILYLAHELENTGGLSQDLNFFIELSGQHGTVSDLVKLSREVISI